MLEAAASGGAQALGRRLGALAPGRRADIVVLDPEHPALVGKAADAWLDSWLFAGGPGAVREVWAHGRRVVDHGRHVNRERTGRRFAATMRALLSG